MTNQNQDEDKQQNIAHYVLILANVSEDTDLDLVFVHESSKNSNGSVKYQADDKVPVVNSDCILY